MFILIQNHIFNFISCLDHFPSTVLPPCPANGSNASCEGANAAAAPLVPLTVDPRRITFLQMKKFSDWLVSELAKQQISAAQFSRLSRKDQGVISRLLSGERNPSNKTILAIAVALKLPAEMVFRAAGVLPPKPDSDPWKEEMRHLLDGIMMEDREIIRKILRSYADKTTGPGPMEKGSGQ